jgi:hypothetical protein
LPDDIGVNMGGKVKAYADALWAGLLRVVIGDVYDPGREGEANRNGCGGSMRVRSAGEGSCPGGRCKRSFEQDAFRVGVPESKMRASAKFVEDLNQILGQRRIVTGSRVCHASSLAD